MNLWLILTYCGHCMISVLYHIFNKYNSKCDIIYVFRFVFETITSYKLTFFIVSSIYVYSCSTPSFSGPSFSSPANSSHPNMTIERSQNERHINYPHPYVCQSWIVGRDRSSVISKKDLSQSDQKHCSNFRSLCASRRSLLDPRAWAYSYGSPGPWFSHGWSLVVRKRKDKEDVIGASRGNTYMYLEVIWPPIEPCWVRPVHRPTRLRG